MTKGTVAVVALVTGAFVWGVIWYPYRSLAAAGVGGIGATTATYAVALAAVLLLGRPGLFRVRAPGTMLALALAAAGCNIGYVLATLTGEVMRVLLLFYLAPLWTVLLARGLLGERLTRVGGAVVVLSLAGAATMLWRPQLGWPVPRDGADWLGLGAGFSFALFNVLSRRAAAVPVEQRLLVSFAGVAGCGALLHVLLALPLPVAGLVRPEVLLLLLLLGGLLLVINRVVQFGLEHTPANQAIVIMLSEVGFAGVSAWLLAGEAMGGQEWAGGAMIVAASLFSARMVPPDEPRA